MGNPDQAGSALNGQEQERRKRQGATQLARALPSRSLGQLGLLTAFRIRVGLGNAGIRLTSVPSFQEP